MNLLICYKKCTTCKGVEKLLQEKGIAYEYREIDKEVPTKEELRAWREKTELPLKRFFNTSGIKYRELNLKDKLGEMSDEEQYELLATDGMLIKRPIYLEGEEIFVGPDVKKHLSK